jgi:hypothetical protein
MKIDSKVALVATLFALSSSPAIAATQSIDCHFANPSEKDHVLVSLVSDQTGSFTYSSGPDAENEGSQTDKLTLVRLPNSANAATATFQASAQAPDNATRVSFTFSLPTAVLQKAAPTFKGQLATEILTLKTSEGQDLVCSSVLN